MFIFAHYPLFGGWMTEQYRLKEHCNKMLVLYLQ